MLDPRIKFGIAMAVGILVLAVGAVDLVRGFGNGVNIRNVIVGAVCIVLGGWWVVRLLIGLKGHGPEGE
jgi:hypothetical protein